MRIGIFTETYLPDTNGVVVSLLRFKKELEKAGHEVFVFAPGSNMRFRYSPKNKTWFFPSIGTLGDGALRVAAPIVSPKEFWRFKLDIVHTYAPGPMGFLGVAVAKKLKLPLIHTFHTFLEEYVHYLHIENRSAKTIVRWIIKNFLKKHDCVIVPSSAIKKYVLAYKINKPVSVIPTGIDTKEMRRLRCRQNFVRLSQKLKISGRDSFLMSAGRLGKEKGFDFLLEVMANLQKTNPETKLVIAGDGPERKSLENMAADFGVKNKIIFAGIIPQNDMFCLLRMAKVFVFASLTETQGLVTMEAMALGVPVVAIKAQGTEDVLAGNKGGFMTARSVKSFADKIRLLLINNAVRKKKSAEARKIARNFSMSNLTKKLISIYRNFAKRT